MRPAQVIQHKRDGGVLDPADLEAFLHAFHREEVPDYQMAAFLMAVYFRGLDPSELDVLVQVIIESGRTLDFSGAPGRRVDKHSTGGVGDKVSLVLVPLVAALGAQVPMMSGRGLGHTGGTVDKLETIPGFRMDLPFDRLRSQVLEHGAALITQTPDIAPLDGRLYALRDVTATVESIPLIASSIMSKKIAEGIDGLVLDVKVGNGAFTPDEDRALDLARTMIRIGEAKGLKVVACLTAMDRPLGRAIGNALELKEALDALRGGGPDDLREVTLALAAEMLVLGGAADDLDDARGRAAAALDDGRAMARFRALVELQGGDVTVLDDPDRLPVAPVIRPVGAGADGVILGVATRAIGEAAVSLGAGRARMDDEIDPAAGIVMRRSVGDRVSAGDPVAEIHARTEADADAAARAVADALEIGDGAAAARPLISHRVTAAGVEPLN